MTPPATLHVERTPGALQYRLEPSPGDGVRPVKEFAIQPIRDEELYALQATAASLLRSLPSASFPAEAMARGRLLYAAFIPPQLRDDLVALRGPLLVSTTVPGLPFELLFDDEFWGLRYALGKQVLVEGPRLRHTRPRPSSRLRVLIVCSDPRGDVPAVHEEAERVFESLLPLADVHLIAGREATFDGVAMRLGEHFDVVHYCGHVLAGGPASGLLLADERVLSGAVISRTLRGEPVVFLNGCATTRSVPPTGGRAWEVDVQSVTYGFMLGGARAVIGTISDVSDAHAATIAIEFYRRAIDGEPLGEALRLARLHGRKQMPESPTWLSFALYGDPTLPLIVNGAGNTVSHAPTDDPPVEPPARPRPRRWGWFVTAAVLIAAGWVCTRPEFGYRLRAYWAVFASAPSEAVRKTVVTTADYFHERGQYGTERWFREQGLRLTSELHGARHRETAAQQNNLGEVYRNLGDPQRAMPLYQQALATLFDIGAAAPDQAQIWSNLGLVHDALRQFDAATRCYAHALRLHRSLPKSLLARLFNNLGLLERRRGRLDVAKSWYIRSTRLYTKGGLGTDNPEYITPLNNLCVLYADKTVEQLALAEDTCRKALTLARRSLPPGHPERIGPRRNLIAVLRLQRRHVEADHLEREAD